MGWSPSGGTGRLQWICAPQIIGTGAYYLTKSAEKSIRGVPVSNSICPAEGLFSFEKQLK